MKIFSDLYIDGRWCGGPDRIAVSNPATGALIANVATSGWDECAAAIDAADRAAACWSRTPPRQRSEVLRRAFALLKDEAEEFARLITRENGKILADARAEVDYAAEFFRWFAEEAVRVPGDFRRSPAGDKTIVTTHDPIGVSLLITPWNFPAAMATRKIAPALAAGCTMILKPAASTPLTALAIADLLERAGVPSGVVNVVLPVPVSPAVHRMSQDPRVRSLSFTGSTEVGRVLLHACADTVVRASMELGGNAPFLVLEGADVNAAVDAAMAAKMRNGGAACTAANASTYTIRWPRRSLPSSRRAWARSALDRAKTPTVTSAHSCPSRSATRSRSPWRRRCGTVRGPRRAASVPAAPVPSSRRRSSRTFRPPPPSCGPRYSGR